MIIWTFEAPHKVVAVYGCVRKDFFVERHGRDNIKKLAKLWLLLNRLEVV